VHCTVDKGGNSPVGAQGGKLALIKSYRELMGTIKARCYHEVECLSVQRPALMDNGKLRADRINL
jgi:hypothetical protein